LAPRSAPAAAPSSPAAPDPGQGGSVTPLPERYEDALDELETLVGAMEAGALPLDTLLANYQRGAALLNHCRSRLNAVEQQVQVLEDGQLKPWIAAP
jgi:exodeoxyribonuclease VII small subunit